MQCAQGYSGCIGVSPNGSHAASRGVAGFPVLCDRPPQVVMVLRIEHGDVGVVRGHGDKRKQPRGVGEVERLEADEFSHDRIPRWRSRDQPKTTDVGLLGCSLGAVQAADLTDLVQVSGPRVGMFRLGSKQPVCSQVDVVISPASCCRGEPPAA